LPTPRSGPCRYGWFGVVGLAADFAKLIADETEKWGNFIRALNIKAE
jgi:NADH:ubiquinone oxidoreductase subunit H